MRRLMSTSQDDVDVADVLGSAAAYAGSSPVGGTLLHSRQDRVLGEAGRSAGRLRAFRPDLQGPRALAVLAVVAYHAGVPGITGGFVGVDIFLVISGFLITSQLM